MDNRWDAVVIGAGITGLSAAYELRRRGRSVLVVERTAVAAEQSAGLVRIFRILHGSPHMCALASDARAGWHRWEEQLGFGRLLGREQLVSIGPLVAAQSAAMHAAGAEVRAASADDIAALVPHLAVDPDRGDAIVDPAAGVLRIRRIHAALASRLTVVAGDVVAVEDGRDDAMVKLADGSSLRAERVLVCAGTATGSLAEAAGIPIDLTWTRHVRLTYAARNGRPLPSSSAVVLESAYGLPVGSTGLWALGLDDLSHTVASDATDPGVHAQAVRRQHAEWLPTNMPTLDPEPVDEIRCVSLDAPWLDARGDGFIAARRGRIVACTGSNMMKFGPLLGDRLALTAVGPDDEVHPDLCPQASAAVVVD